MKEDSSTVEIVDGTHVIFTSKELYVGAYDPEVDTAIFCRPTTSSSVSPIIWTIRKSLSVSDLPVSIWAALPR